ncbi:hypothetical protein DF033_31995 [Burkholderia cenocepacia]|nr:hypothetical protein DF033_31995 [Burkholderia cenocepacia]
MKIEIRKVIIEARVVDDRQITSMGRRDTGAIAREGTLDEARFVERVVLRVLDILQDRQDQV